MKKIFTFIVLVFCITSVFCQKRDAVYNINFDDTNNLSHLFIDTISNPNNLWQIGEPQKTVFTSAHSIPNAIVTDTLYSYPKNNISSFIILDYPAGGFSGEGMTLIGGYYKVNSDTLKDYGTIEFSYDNGTTWVNINDTLYKFYVMYIPPKPVLTGNSNGWIHFSFGVSGLNLLPGAHGDTILFRFSFVSDSIQNNLDGLMYDDFQINDFAGSVEDINSMGINSKIYPNPASTQITIELPKKEEQSIITIYNLNGEELIKQQIKNNKTDVDISELQSGVYFIKIVNNKNVEIKKIIKQ
ncbi:MAG: T9SS type A sorting domain-containing protein [Bacteroidales bacterium]|jgi:hypothetical protein